MVFIYANHLCRKGFHVTICFDCTNMLTRYPIPAFARRVVSRALVKYRPTWFALDARVAKRCIFGIDNKSIPDSDHVVATWVKSATPVSKLSESKGRKHYFIQDYETWSMPASDVEATYRLGMSNIVVSDWLAEIVENACGVKPLKVKNPIDDKVFFPEDCVRHDNEVAVLYHPGEHKGFKDAFAALELAHEQIPGLVANVFGGPKRPAWLPEWCNYTRNASQERLRNIYSRSSAFLCATVNEGFALTCPEAMLCGCALVSTDFQGVHEYADSECALLSPVGDYRKLAANLIGLLSDSDEARRIAKLGRARVLAECSMPRAFSLIEREFKK